VAHHPNPVKEKSDEQSECSPKESEGGGVMATRAKGRRPRPEDPILDAIQCLRAMADARPDMYWHQLAVIGLFASTWVPTPRERALARRLRRTAMRQSDLIKRTADDEAQDWLRRQLSGLGEGS
jgi:hypothetical protein